MDIFEDLWREQSETINKELEKMPLSYINDTLKMYSHIDSGTITILSVAFCQKPAFYKYLSPYLIGSQIVSLFV